MNNIGKRIVAIFCFLLLAATYVQAQEHVCYVGYSYVDTQTQIRSSLFGLGEFRTSFADNTVTRSFKHDESKVTVNVGVEYPSRGVGNENAGLMLAIAFSEKPENVFDEAGRAEAQASGNNPMMNSLILNKSVEGRNHIWTFYLSCVPKKDVNADASRRVNSRVGRLRALKRQNKK